MKKKLSTRLVAVGLVLVLVMGLMACNNTSNNNSTKESNETESTTVNEKELINELTLVLTKDDISLLNEYPNLKKIDATGSTCYDELLNYSTNNPDVEVIYNVPLGTTTVTTSETTLTLAEGSYDYETLKTNLKYLPKITAITFPDSTLTEAKVSELRKAYPNVAIKYTAKQQSSSQGTTKPTVTPNTGSSSATDTKITVDSSWTVHDWTNINSSQVATAIENAKALSGNCVVKLNSSLTKAEVKSLQAAAPSVIFDYSFKLYGKELSTLSKTVAYVNTKIGDSGAQEIKDALSILTKCTYFKLDNCNISNEVMAGIRDAYPNKSIVWRIYQKTPSSTRSWLTDTEVLRAVYHVDDSNSGVFKYLTKVKYTDLGHNTNMKNLSFLSYMPNLEIAILSGSPITDVSPLKNLKKLEFLELAWCGWLTDISPLAGCTGLKYLNLGHTRVKDMSALKNLSLKQLSYVASGARGNNLTEADWAKIQQQHPNCWITYQPLNDLEATPYSTGWRYKKEGGYTDCYRKVRDVFGYDAIDKVLQGQK